MEKVIRIIERGVVKVLVFPFGREEPVELAACGLCKKKVAAALVRLKYPQEEVEGILCDSLARPEDKGARRALAELAAYRRECEAEADKIMEEYEKPQA